MLMVAEMTGNLFEEPPDPGAEQAADTMPGPKIPPEPPDPIPTRPIRS